MPRTRKRITADHKPQSTVMKLRETGDGQHQNDTIEKLAKLEIQQATDEFEEDTSAGDYEHEWIWSVCQHCLLVCLSMYRWLTRPPHLVYKLARQ